MPKLPPPPYFRGPINAQYTPYSVKTPKIHSSDFCWIHSLEVNYCDIGFRLLFSVYDIVIAQDG